MTIDDAIKILDPETRRVTLRAIPVLERIDKDQEPCRLAVAALRRQEEPRWIPVKDRLPEEKQRVLVRCKTVGTTVGWRLWGEWMTDLGDGGSEVTNWMPLPEPYTADAEENEGVQPAHWEKTDIPLPYQVRTVPTPSGTFAHREMYVCSACDGYNDKNTQYCPNCGAKMDKEANEND